MDLDSISPQDLKRRLDTDETILLLDVREDVERSFCAIPASTQTLDLHIPMREVPARLAEVVGHHRPIVVYCHHGVRSMVVARWLASRFPAKVLNLEGGIEAWTTEVDPAMPRY